MKFADNNFIRFIRKNLAYVVLGICILTMVLSTVLVLVNKDSSLPVVGETPDDDNVGTEKPIDPNQPSEPVEDVITFIMPITSATSIEDYCETMVFNSTLNRYSAHLAIDFFAPENTDVLAVYGGTVESVETSLLTGTTIIIDHGNGLKTSYNSLADGDMVSVNQKVEQGDVIGQVSTTNRQEYKSGAHLHFQVLENGEAINPDKYLNLDLK